MSVRLDSAALGRLLGSEAGPVVQHLARLGERTRILARERVGVSRPQLFSAIPSGPGENLGGHVRDAIVMRIEASQVKVGVFSDPPAERALYHHQGTRPHPILPRRGQFLRFFWPRVPGIVFLRRVSHPGSKPNPYLTSSLEDVVRQS